MHNDMRNLRRIFLWVAGAAFFLPACTPKGRADTPIAPFALAKGAKTNTCGRLHGGGAERLGPARASSPVALARVAAGKLAGHVVAYVADADEPALRTIDVDERAEIASTPL